VSCFLGHVGKSGLAAGFGRLLGTLDRQLCVLAATPVVAFFLASVLPALLLIWIWQEVSGNDE
jgi:hypothetical protein